LYSPKGKQDDKIQKYHKKGEGKMSIRERFEKVMMAATFAEAGEHDTALEIMGEEKRARKQERKAVRLGVFDRIMMAATFAEAGEHDTALEIMAEEKRVRKQDRKTVRPMARLQMRAPSARG
jgi:lipopolysaccharide biosynthesis protein